jgi:hypothetical protein
MCDYSLHSHPNRLAEAGETLIATRFSFGSIGFASASELASRAALEFQTAPLTAVCVPPGARLTLNDIPTHLQQELGVGETEEVTFTQLGCDAWAYRDAVRFSNGKQILLQRLNEKQRAVVLSLDSERVFGDVEVAVPVL